MVNMLIALSNTRCCLYTPGDLCNCYWMNADLHVAAENSQSLRSVSLRPHYCNETEDEQRAQAAGVQTSPTKVNFSQDESPGKPSPRGKSSNCWSVRTDSPSVIRTNCQKQLPRVSLPQVTKSQVPKGQLDQKHNTPGGGWYAPEVDNTAVVGRVISRLEVVQHALGLCQHKVPLLPLEGLPQGHTLPAAVLPYSLLQIPSLEFSYKVCTMCQVAGAWHLQCPCTLCTEATGLLF